MSKQHGPKREIVLANLINEPRRIMNLLAVGREDDKGNFPNQETNFVLRKMDMMESRKNQWRGSRLHEITIPRSCAFTLTKTIDKELFAGAKQTTERTTVLQPSESAWRPPAEFAENS